MLFLDSFLVIVVSAKDDTCNQTIRSVFAIIKRLLGIGIYKFLRTVPSNMIDWMAYNADVCNTYIIAALLDIYHKNITDILSA